jgi:hypothetical protein
VESDANIRKTRSGIVYGTTAGGFASDTLYFFLKHQRKNFILRLLTSRLKYENS